MGHGVLPCWSHPAEAGSEFVCLGNPPCVDLLCVNLSFHLSPPSLPLPCSLAGIKLTLSALLDGKNVNAGGHKLGLGLEFQA